MIRSALRARSSAASAVAATCLALALTACGGTADDEGSDAPGGADGTGGSGGSSHTDGGSGGSGGSTGSSQAADALVIEVMIEGGSVSPNAERVEATLGQPITFRVTTDRVAEIHGHTDPAFTIEAQPGASEHTLTIDRAGSYDIELHDPAHLLVRVDVRP